MINSRVKGNYKVKTRVFIVVHFERASFMDLEFSNGQMAHNTKGIMLMDSAKEMVNSLTLKIPASRKAGGEKEF